MIRFVLALALAACGGAVATPDPEPCPVADAGPPDPCAARKVEEWCAIVAAGGYGLELADRCCTQWIDGAVQRP